jgi:alcohol dehydrogenase/L-iditol 2-dehydrogenase
VKCRLNFSSAGDISGAEASAVCCIFNRSFFIFHFSFFITSSPMTQSAVVQYALAPMAVELREVPVPEIGADDVLLAVGAVSVCGSDVHQAFNTHSWPVNIPVTLGHEFGGTIAKLGSGVRGFREGDRVVSETAAVICGACAMCRSGRYNLCPTRKGFGYGVDGAMAEYVKVPGRCLHHVPDTLSFDLACLTEPHAVAYNAMCVNVTIRPGDVVVVLGPGPIGLLCARMAALSGANPLVMAGLTSDAERLETARRLGATHLVNAQVDDLEAIVRELSPLGADVVCDASGSSRTLAAALSLVRPDGQVTKVGWSPEPLGVDLNPLVQKNVRLQGSFSHNWPIWERVLHLLASGLTGAEHIVGLRAGLPRWREAFDAMHEGRVIKSVLLPDADAH